MFWLYLHYLVINQALHITLTLLDYVKFPKFSLPKSSHSSLNSLASPTGRSS